MMANLPDRNAETRRGAFGLISDERLLDCGLKNSPVAFRGITMFVGEENSPTPMPFIAATVKECEEPARSPTMVWTVSASTMT